MGEREIAKLLFILLSLDSIMHKLMHLFIAFFGFAD